jgi:membrane-bound lytic murein transglycosylase B
MIKQKIRKLRPIYLSAMGFFIFVGCLGIASPDVADISFRSDVRNFMDFMVKKHKFKKKEMIALFKQVKTKKKIIEAITRPAEGKPWHKYRPIFVTQTRINEGVTFWNKNEKILKKAYEKYGVPPEMIVAIIGVETRYGKFKGKYRVMDALATLAFNYPKRGKFFRGELVEFLLLAREEKIYPLSLKGSYAGAMGKPQFISSSFRRYAVDFNADGKRDLWNNSADAIGSVANYFKRHHWSKDGPVVGRAKVTGKAYKSILKKGLKPHIKLTDLAKKGINTKANLASSGLASLIELKLKKGVEHWIAMKNFYVITRYNHSKLYAMAAYQLSQAIIKRRKASKSKSATDKMV